MEKVAHKLGSRQFRRQKKPPKTREELGLLSHAEMVQGRRWRPARLRETTSRRHLLQRQLSSGHPCFAQA